MMRIVITQTTVVIDIPETTEQPAHKPVNPLTLLEKLRKEAETGRDTTLWSTPLEATIYGTILS